MLAEVFVSVPSVRHAMFAAAAAFLLIAPAKVARAQSSFDASVIKGPKWRMIGPYRGGRTKSGVGVPSQPNVFYIGMVNGGVWKTTDYGRTWKPIFDEQPSGSIGAIDVSLTNPNIVYVGSGEGLHVGPTWPPATASTNRPTPAGRGRTSACETVSRSHASRSTRRIRTGCSSRCSDIPMGPTRSAAFFVR